MTFGVEIAVAVGPQGPKGAAGDTGVKAVIATTTDITLLGEQTIDGVLTSLTRVLVKDQVDQTQNGVYVSAPGVWVRATNFDTWPEITGAIVTVIEGDTNASTVWLCSVPATGVIDVDNIVFAPVSGGGVGTGTVTSVSVTTANGISGTVSTPSSTPAITLTLGAITPGSVAASGSVSGSNLSGTNTGDQTITLTGMVTGSGTGSFATTIAAGVVTNSMLAGGIAASKLVGTDIATVGTVTAGTWTATPIAGAYQVAMVGDTGTGGTQGAVPAPAAGDAAANKYLKADGTWSPVLNTGGTVTSVSVVSASGVSGTVSNPTTTPAITVVLGNIVPASVNAVGLVLGSNLQGTNTGDQTITLTGDVTGSGGGSFSATIAAGAVTNAKIASGAGIDVNKLAAQTASRATVFDSSGFISPSITTAAEIAFVNGVTSPIQAQFNARPIPQAPTVNAWVYVSQYGNDTTGDGTYDRPFATTTKAQSIITDAATGKRYGIHIRGTVTETNIYLAPYTWYYGDTWGCSRLNASSGNVTLDPTKFASGNSRCGMTNVYLTGSTGINLDFVAVSAAGSHVIEMDHLGINGSVTINPANTNQYFQWEGGGLVFGNFTAHGALGLIFNLFVAGNATVDQMATPQDLSGQGINFQNCLVAGNMSVSTSGSLGNPVTMTASTVSGILTITNTGASVIADATSLPLKAQISLVSGGAITRLTDVYSTAYAPTTAGNWNSVPTENQAALDTLASSGVVKSQTQNLFLASPDGSSGTPSFRAIVTADLPPGPPPVGTANTVSGYDNGGNLYSIPGWSIFTNTGGLDQNITQQPNDFNAGLQINTVQANFDPLQNSPNDNYTVLETAVNIDPSNTGFDLGTNGRFVTGQNIDFAHQGKSNTGQLVGRNIYYNIGNGTDPIDVKGISGDYISGDVLSGVNMSAGVEGYHFNFHVHPGVTFPNSGAFSSAFVDNGHFETSVPGYNSFAANVRIDEIQNNNNYTGVTVNAEIGNLAGNANYTGVGLYGSVGTMGTGGYTGVQVNPTITHLTANSRGIGVYGSTTDGTAEWIGVDIQANNVHTTGNIRGLRVNVPISNTNDTVALDVNGHMTSNANISLVSGQGQSYCNVIGGSISIPAGTAITGTDTLGNNMAISVDLGDAGSSWTAASVVGLTTLGFVGTIQGAGAANGAINFCLNGFADMHTGHIDRVNNFFAAGIPTGAGGTMDEHVLYFGDMPAGPLATTEWGIRMDYAGGENYVPRLSVNTTNKKVSGPSVGLELAGNDRAFLPSRMTAAERNALTAVNGMILYNSDAQQLEGYQNGAWSPLSGGGTVPRNLTAQWLTADGSTFTVTHNWGTRNIRAEVIDNGSNYETIITDVSRPTDNTMVFSSSEPPGSAWTVLLTEVLN